MEYLLYGANGYTAKLIIDVSKQKGLTPVLAGRNREKIEKLAQEHHLPFKVFDLNDQDQITAGIREHSLCVNAAGPFSRTALPIVEACLSEGVHYLDITGEIAVFEQLKSLSAKAEQAGITVMPGVGFDVVPSDCLANYLREKMPDATVLELAFTNRGSGLSHGTASTMLSHLGEGGAVRREGKIQRVDLYHKQKTVDFGGFSRQVATIPWGDISTAYTSTGIPNIEVYTRVQPNMLKAMKFQWLLNPILRTSLVKKLGQNWIDKNLSGPTEAQNRKGRSFLHGMVSNGTDRHCALLSCPESYWLTALCTVNIAQKVLNKQFKTGYQTPAGAYGWPLILEMPDSEITDTDCK